MTEQPTLTKLEHYLLRSTMDAAEPLNVMYAETMDRVPGVRLDSFVAAWVRLVGLGFVKCYFDDYRQGKVRVCDDLREELLSQHFAGRSEEQRRSFPETKYGGEYEFKATSRGMEEESKTLYQSYYNYSE